MHGVKSSLYLEFRCPCINTLLTVCFLVFSFRRLHEREPRFKPPLSAFDFQRLLYNLTGLKISNAGGHNCKFVSRCMWDARRLRFDIRAELRNMVICEPPVSARWPPRDNSDQTVYFSFFEKKKEQKMMKSAIKQLRKQYQHLGIVQPFQVCRSPKKKQDI